MKKEEITEEEYNKKSAQMNEWMNEWMESEYMRKRFTKLQLIIIKTKANQKNCELGMRY